MRSATALCLLLLVASACGATPGIARPSPTEVLGKISVYGGGPVLDELWRDQEAFETVLVGIETADADWLAVAAALLPHSDAASSLSLNYALAIALSRSPSDVLALVGDVVRLERICTSPFIEPEPDVAETYEHKVLAALNSVSDPSLSQLADDCAARIRGAAPNFAFQGKPLRGSPELGC